MTEKLELPPITLPKGKRTEGTLLNEPVKRVTKKSGFLIQIEAEQRAKAGMQPTLSESTSLGELLLFYHPELRRARK